jgi:hypothetical protein
MRGAVLWGRAFVFAGSKGWGHPQFRVVGRTWSSVRSVSGDPMTRVFSSLRVCWLPRLYNTYATDAYCCSASGSFHIRHNHFALSRAGGHAPPAMTSSTSSTVRGVTV